MEGGQCRMWIGAEYRQGEMNARDISAIRATAHEWLARHHPEDIDHYFEQPPPQLLDRGKPSARRDCRQILLSASFASNQ